MSDGNSDRRRSGESRARLRTRHAYERVSSWPSTSRAGAVQRAKSLPVEVRTLGITTAVANLAREDTPQAHALINGLAAWILDDAAGLPPQQTGTVSATTRDLLDICVKADRATYRAVQAESLAYLEQVKLLADALYGQEVK